MRGKGALHSRITAEGRQRIAPRQGRRARMALPSFFYGVRQENFPTEGIPLAQIRNDGMY